MNHIETIESRRLLSVAVDDGGTLRVSATADADVVAITLNSGTLHVSVNGQVTDFPKADVKRISISTKGGNDSIDLHGINLRARVNAGSGSDSILCGNGADRVIGGSGNDSISGNKGDDSISGNAGRDSINCGQGDDSASGDAGNDTILCGNGDDEVVGGDGEDRIFGGSGADQFDTLGTAGECKDFKSGEGDHTLGSADNSGGSILIKYTYPGDANLDGVVDEKDSNSLGLWISDDLSNTHYPWTLDPKNPSHSDTSTGDNMEQVLWQDPSAGSNFTVHVGLPPATDR